jgi:hypothetical protein
VKSSGGVGPLRRGIESMPGKLRRGRADVCARPSTGGRSLTSVHRRGSVPPSIRPPLVCDLVKRGASDRSLLFSARTEPVNPVKASRASVAATSLAAPR